MCLTPPMFLTRPVELLHVLRHRPDVPRRCRILLVCVFVDRQLLALGVLVEGEHGADAVDVLLLALVRHLSCRAGAEAQHAAHQLLPVLVLGLVVPHLVLEILVIDAREIGGGDLRLGVLSQLGCCTCEPLISAVISLIGWLRCAYCSCMYWLRAGVLRR